MNWEMWVCNSTSSCLELPCSVDSPLVNLLSWNPSLVWTACQELTVFAQGVHWSSDWTTLPKSVSLGPSSTRFRRSSQTLLRSNLLLSILQIKSVVRARTSSTSLSYWQSILTLVLISLLLICLVSLEFQWQVQTKLRISNKLPKRCAAGMSPTPELLFSVCCQQMLIWPRQMGSRWQDKLTLRE